MLGRYGMPAGKLVPRVRCGHRLILVGCGHHLCNWSSLVTVVVYYMICGGQGRRMCCTGRVLVGLAAMCVCEQWKEVGRKWCISYS